MKKTRIILDRRFLADVGFVAACRRPANHATQRLLPRLREAVGASEFGTLEELNAKLVTYEPSRWVGYHIDRQVNYAIVHDGLFRIPVPVGPAIATLLADLRRVHFAHTGNAPLPIEGGISAALDEPAQILLHDTHVGTTYLEPFEGGTMFLWHQAQGGVRRT